jgi:signal transduction histidine kinase
VIRSANIPRALYAAVLLTVLVASLLVGWFVSGWRDVRMRQAEIRTAPHVAADQRALQLARELRAELERLIGREVSRPYFHYQNLMHDPQTSAGVSVSQSPLANGPGDNLVAGYFQLDSKGRTTTPTVNDEVPELSASERLAQNRAFRDQVAHDLSRQLAPAERPKAQVAVKTGSPPGPGVPPRPRLEDGARSQQPTTQVIRVDPSVYAQNANPNAVYSQQAVIPDLLDKRPVVPPKVAPSVAPAISGPVTITISPLEWRTMPFAGGSTLIAVRHVETPDRSLTQGFVIDRRALTTWLATRSGDMLAELRPDDSLGVPVVPQWGLTVQPNPASVTKAAEEVSAAERKFLIRFVGVGGVSVLTAALVLLLVTRAEKLARERSEFAAAAAHELRTPLAGLQLYGEMLAEGLGDPAKMRDYARRMSEDSARLGRVVSNILGFSQLERANLAVEARSDLLSDVLCELADGARPALERSGARLELDVSGDLRAHFDRDALARIVSNLLDNAEKYARHAADRTIRLAAVDRGDVVEVTVADRGPGILDSSKVFHPFSRGVSGGDVPAGLGLGLALSRSLARAMGGDLDHKARDGGGSTFVLQMRRD